MPIRIPVTVVTGFLGAGKTTLVNAWLGGYGRGEVAVIVNEVGTIGVDGELLADRVRTLVEITGGCVCCRTQRELVLALEKLATEVPAPGRVVVETSGAASPAGVLRALAAGGERGAFALDGVITVVDAARVDRVLDHDLAVEQVACADVVVLSRADTCDSAALAHAESRVAEHAGAAIVVHANAGTVTGGDGTLEALLARARDTFPSPRPVSPARSASHVYETVSLILEGDVDGERFADFVEDELGRIAGRLFRTKGIVSVAGIDARMIVQGVADLVEVTFGAPWRAEERRTSRLVLVGFGLDPVALESAFRVCALLAPPP